MGFPPQSYTSIELGDSLYSRFTSMYFLGFSTSMSPPSQSKEGEPCIHITGFSTSWKIINYSCRNIRRMWRIWGVDAFIILDYK